MSKSKDRPKLNLDLLKKLVAELEVAAQTSDAVVSDINQNNYIVELAKASGLALGIAHEANALMTDIYSLVRMVQGPVMKNDLLDKILGPLKGTGNAN